MLTVVFHSHQLSTCLKYIDLLYIRVFLPKKIKQEKELMLTSAYFTGLQCSPFNDKRYVCRIMIILGKLITIRFSF